MGIWAFKEKRGERVCRREAIKETGARHTVHIYCYITMRLNGGKVYLDGNKYHLLSCSPAILVSIIPFSLETPPATHYSAPLRI